MLRLLAAQAAVAIEHAALRERLDGLSFTDPLTGLATRRMWDEELPRELARTRRTESPLTIALLDIDHMSAFNMLRGEREGDRLIKECGSRWRNELREVDFLARLDGTEFAIDPARLRPRRGVRRARPRPRVHPARADRLRGRRALGRRGARRAAPRPRAGRARRRQVGGAQRHHRRRLSAVLTSSAVEDLRSAAWSLPSILSRSGFGERSTAAEVLDGIDLSGRLAIVTGGYSGLGLETDARAGRRRRAGRRAGPAAGGRRGGARRASTASRSTTLDLGDLDSVRAFADRFLDAGRGIDILINNAAIMACPETRVGPGWEAQFATNHLGHFALVEPALAGARRATAAPASSRSPPPATGARGIRFDDLQFEHRLRQVGRPTARPRPPTCLFAVAPRRARARTRACAPSRSTRAGSSRRSSATCRARRWSRSAGSTPTATAAATAFKTPEQGAATADLVRDVAQLDGMGGVYCEDCDIAAPTDGRRREHRACGAYAIDPEAAARLWTVSAELTGVDAFAAA